VITPTKQAIERLYQVFSLVSTITVFAATSVLAKAQSQFNPGDSLGAVTNTTTAQPDSTYIRPTEKTKLHNYLFATVGPYPIVAIALIAGDNQLGNSPPEWKQGAEGYGKRFGSDFAIAGIATTTRYALAEAFKEDTLYYRCACKGVFPRLSHAVMSSFTARHGEDGHSTFSFPAVIAPYVGTMTAVSGWYPGPYDASDALRLGNYGLLGYVGWNIALEFLHKGPRDSPSAKQISKSLPTPGPGSSR
jgi:hypothetical protein